MKKDIPKDGYKIDGLTHAYRSTAFALMQRMNLKTVENQNGQKYTIDELKNAIIK